MAFAPVTTRMSFEWNEDILKPLRRDPNLYADLLEEGYLYGTDCTVFAVCAENPNEHNDCVACVHSRIPEADGHVYTIVPNPANPNTGLTTCRHCGGPAEIQ